jgi:peroxiredoxin
VILPPTSRLWQSAAFTAVARNKGTERTTYIIGPDQKIKAILKKVKSPGHVALLSQALAS